ncbi:MAG TPA: hypothetical protein VMH89_03265 [Candidatus Acidoferrum sp.]|nr:hypothetical protein [Candidatus Acidoferrum sp.]
MRKRPRSFKEMAALDAAIQKYCGELAKDKRELIRNNLLLASSVTTSNLEEIVERIVGPEDFLRR